MCQGSEALSVRVSLSSVTARGTAGNVRLLVVFVALWLSNSHKSFFGGPITAVAREDAVLIVKIGIFFGRFLSAFYLRLFLLGFALAPALVVFGRFLLRWFNCHLAAGVGCQPGSEELLALFSFVSFHVVHLVPKRSILARALQSVDLKKEMEPKEKYGVVWVWCKDRDMGEVQTGGPYHRPYKSAIDVLSLSRAIKRSASLGRGLLGVIRPLGSSDDKGICRRICVLQDRLERERHFHFTALSTQESILSLDSN
ncbi:hypothetical protein F2Q69_00012915 [Brassica cretica]|uniref:Uncharacterized protein n=1 Tax=Brassica cretica TaxID=69181 RepID=A0A8S9QW60_BRACR|nr:hypothetical protein F2Q69_00012915 [Brassica cretica]